MSSSLLRSRSAHRLIARSSKLASNSVSVQASEAPVVADPFRLETINDTERHQQVLDFIEATLYPQESVRTAPVFGLGVYRLIDKVPDYLNDGLSVSVVNAEDSQIVGVAINSLITKHSLSYNQPTVNGREKVITACLKALQSHNLFHKYPVHRGMNMFFLGVKGSYEGHGLASRMINRSISLALQRQLDFVQSLPSSPKMLHLFEKQDFLTLNEIKLVDCKVDGEAAFPHANADDSFRHVVKFL